MSIFIEKEVFFPSPPRFTVYNKKHLDSRESSAIFKAARKNNIKSLKQFESRFHICRKLQFELAEWNKKLQIEWLYFSTVARSSVHDGIYLWVASQQVFITRWLKKFVEMSKQNYFLTTLLNLQTKFSCSLDKTSFYPQSSIGSGNKKWKIHSFLDLYIVFITTWVYTYSLFTASLLEKIKTNLSAKLLPLPLRCQSCRDNDAVSYKTLPAGDTNCPDKLLVSLFTV